MGLLALGVPLLSLYAVALTIAIAAPDARGTTLSVRLTAIRLAQFAIPLAAGVVVSSFGAGGTFALSGAAILAATAARPSNVARHGGRSL